MGVPNEQALIVVGFFLTSLYAILFLIKLFHTLYSIQWTRFLNFIFCRGSKNSPKSTSKKKTVGGANSGGLIFEEQQETTHKNTVNKESSEEYMWKAQESDESYREEDRLIYGSADSDFTAESPYFKRYQIALFDICFLTGLLLRGSYFTLLSLETLKVIGISNAIIFFINTSPSFFFFTTYTLLLILWIQIYEHSYPHDTFGWSGTTSGKHRKQTRKANILVNSVVYGAAVIIYSLDMHSSSLSFDDDDDESATVSNVDSAYEKTIIIFVSLFYHLYSKRLYLFDKTERNPNILSFLRKIGLFVLLCMIIFLIRAVMALLQLVIEIAGVWWIVLLYYSVLELFPLSIMLLVVTAASSNPLLSI